MTTACSRCNNTGREGSSDYLDCTAPGCDVADTRTKLDAMVNAHMVEHGLMCMQDLIWFVYLHGKSAAFEEAAKACTDADKNTHPSDLADGMRDRLESLQSQTEK